MPRAVSSASSAAFSSRFCWLIGLTPPKRAVVVRDLLEPLVGDAAASRDVAEEGDDVVLALGAAEAGEQDAVVGDRAVGVLGALPRGVARGADEVDGGHQRTTSGTSAEAIRRPVKKGISSRTCRRASVARRSRIMSTRSVSESDSIGRIHS